jgi:dihydropteroate synthase
MRSQVKYGATIVDIGVESTRPGATELNSNDEINLLKEILLTVLELKAELNFCLSIDTYHADTVTWLLNTGTAIDIINDVAGNLPPELIAKLIRNGKRYVAMHNLGIPASSENIMDLDSDPIQVISAFVDNKITQLLDYGVSQDEIEKSVIFDPGIGFGNNSAQAWYILNNLAKLNTHSCELLVGHSRKSLFKHITNKPAKHRDLITAIVAAKMINIADYLRLHDITMLNEVYTAYNQLN